MNIKKTVVFTLCFFVLLAFFSTHVAFAAPQSHSAEIFQITTDNSQQRDAVVNQDTIMWTDFRNAGTSNIDIYGYDHTIQTEFPIITNVGQQWLVGFDNRYVIYNHYNNADDPNTYDVHYFDRKKGVDTAVTNSLGTQEAKDYDSGTIVFIDGYACGTAYAYNIRTKVQTQISSGVCEPIHISNNIIVYALSSSTGSDIWGYDLETNTVFNISEDTGNNSMPDILNDYVVWLKEDGANRSIYMKDLRTGIITLLHQTSDYYINYPAVSHKYAIWGKSHQLHYAGVEGVDIKTGQLFEISPEYPHQNTNLNPTIWNNIAVWMAWRTGNGDIYGATISR